MYNTDQWKVVKALAGALPKRESFKVGDIKSKSFKNAPNDRVVRNAVRKPVKEGHVEICGRGEYRLTAKGAGFFQRMEKEGFKPLAIRQMAKPAQPIKKSPKKNIIAKEPAKKAAAPKATAKKPGRPKKTTPKVVAAELPKAVKKSTLKIPRPKAKVEEPATEKTEEPAAAAPEEAKGDNATLSF